MSVVPDYPDYSPHVATAQQIAATGAPLLNLSALVTSKVNQSIAPSGTIFTNPQIMTQPGYEIRVQLSTTAGTAVPFGRIDLFWVDQPSGVQIGVDSYHMPAATGPGMWTAYMRGVTKASTLNVVLNNLDGTATMTGTIYLLQSSRVYPADEIHYSNADNASQAVAGFTLPVLPTDNTVLGMVSGLVVNASSSSNPYLFGIGDGLTGVGVNMNAGVLASVVMEIAAAPSSAYVANNPLFAGTPPGPAFQFAAPRCPLRVIIVNQATTAVTLTWSLVRIPA